MFHLKENQTTVRQEILAGLVTFSTMAYIVCVQPALMSGQMTGTPTGMDFGALVTTTCLVSALGCLLMGFWARYPFALAPGMGENFFVVLGVLPVCAQCLGVPVGDAAVWQLALGAVFFSGVLFLLVSLFRIRSWMMNLVSPSLKSAISAGIGLFIAYLGLKSCGIVAVQNNTPCLGSLLSLDCLIFLMGLCVAVFFMVRKIPGGILWGISVSAIVAACCGKITIHGIFSLPADPSCIVGKMDLPGVWTFLRVLLPSILILTFMDIFDTFGTAVGVANQAGFLKDGKLPRMERVFGVDACATIVGAMCGHSTVTSFVESAAGVESGGRTGLTSITVGVLFLLAMFCSPFITAVGSCSAITSSALVLVGILMMQNVRGIAWDDLSEAVPSFLILAGIPFTCSIADGILLGLITWFIMRGFRWKKVSLEKSSFFPRDKPLDN